MKHEVQIPGFRKGKAPETLIMKRFGGAVREEAIKDVVPAVLKEILSEKGITPIGDPEITDFVYEESGSLKFTVSVEELPVVDASRFEELEVTRETLEVSDADVDDYLTRMRESRAVREDVDRPAKENDILMVNLQKLDSSGVPIIGEKIENHIVSINGKGTPSPDFDRQIVGMSKGEKKAVRFTYDESINNPELVGTEDAYEVELLRVIENRVPELDNDLAKAMGYEDVDTLRTKVRESIAFQNDMNAERKMREDLIGEFVKENPFDVPEAMVRRVIDSELEDARRYSRGKSFDEEAFRNRMRADAVRSVQTYIAIEAVKKARGFEATTEEVSDRLERIAALQGKNAREVRRDMIKSGEFESIKNEIAQEKAYEWIKSVAKVTELTMPSVRESRIATP